MKTFVTVTITLLSSLCYCQTPKRTVTWRSGSPGCQIIWTNGVPHEDLIDGARRINVFSPSLKDKKTFSILVLVENGIGLGSFEVNPAMMRASTDEIPQLELKSLSGDALIAEDARKSNRRAAIGAALSGFGAGMSSTSGTIANSDGSTSTVTLHDTSAAQQAQRNAANTRAAINARSADESASLLRRNTLPEGGSVGGKVYMGRPKGMGKKAHIAQFVIDLGDVVYVFPFRDGEI